MFTIYQIIATNGRITASHKEAVEFYRQGYEVAVLVRNGENWEQRALWVH